MSWVLRGSTYFQIFHDFVWKLHPNSSGQNLSNRTHEQFTNTMCCSLDFSMWIHNFQKTSAKSSRRIVSIVLSREKLRRGRDAFLRMIQSNICIELEKCFQERHALVHCSVMFDDFALQCSLGIPPLWNEICDTDWYKNTSRTLDFLMRVYASACVSWCFIIFQKLFPIRLVINSGMSTDNESNLRWKAHAACTASFMRL